MVNSSKRLFVIVFCFCAKQAALPDDLKLPSYHLDTIQRLLNTKPMPDRNRVASAVFWLHRFLAACTTDSRIISILNGLDQIEIVKTTAENFAANTEHPKSQGAIDVELWDNLITISHPSYSNRQIHSLIKDARDRDYFDKLHSQPHVGINDFNRDKEISESSVKYMGSESLQNLQTAILSVPKDQLKETWHALKEPVRNNINCCF
jgi:hypothetical protein